MVAVVIILITPKRGMPSTIPFRIAHFSSLIWRFF